MAMDWQYVRQIGEDIAGLIEYVRRQRFLLKLAEEARELLEVVNLNSAQRL